MNFYNIFLLLLVVLSAYSAYSKPPISTNPIRITNNSIAQLRSLAPVLPENEFFQIILPWNGVYILPQNEVICTLPQNEVNKTVQPQNEVIMSILPQNGVYKTILHQNEMLKSVTANWKLSCNLAIIHVKTFRFCALILSHGVEYIIRISMESIHHISQMYAWSLSENQTSVKFRCKLIGLFVKQSFAVSMTLLFVYTSYILLLLGI